MTCLAPTRNQRLTDSVLWGLVVAYVIGSRLIPREHCLPASDCASEPSRSCLLGFTRHAGDIQPRANLSYPTSPDICEHLVEKNRIRDNRLEETGFCCRVALLSRWQATV